VGKIETTVRTATATCHTARRKRNASRRQRQALKSTKTKTNQITFNEQVTILTAEEKKKNKSCS
jgi:hypothetical protein